MVKTIDFAGVIRIIPLETATRIKLVAQSPYSSVDHKYNIEKTCWNAFWVIFRKLECRILKDYVLEAQAGQRLLVLKEETQDPNTGTMVIKDVPLSMQVSRTLFEQMNAYLDNKKTREELLAGIRENELDLLKWELETELAEWLV